MRPQYKTFHTAGGPDRFKSKFSEVENVEVKNVKNNSYLWSTLVYKNIGVAEGKDIEIKIHSVVPMERVLVTPPGWGSNVKVNMKNDGKQAIITMDDFSTEENTYIFLGMNPPGLSLNQEQLWLQEFDSYLEKSVIESNTADSVFYGEGYAGYFE